VAKCRRPGFAFPSQTPYFGRDGGLDAVRTKTAEAQVCQWRDEGRLSFPNFCAEEIERIRGSYPPPGSSEESAANPASKARLPESPPLVGRCADVRTKNQP
jgi:hypothetical protein